MKRYLLLFSLLIAPACQQSQSDSQAQDFEALIGAERAFANASLTSGTRAAFLEYLAGDAVLFDAGPVNGRELWEARPESNSVLSWRPEIADISVSGDLGYTSGPWEWRADANADPSAWGRFISVWVRHADGVWRVAADGGVAHGPVELNADGSVTRVGDPSDSPMRIGDIDVLAEQEELSELDVEYSRTVAESGFTESLERYVDRAARFYRNGSFPIVGLEAISASPEVTEAVWAEWQQHEAVLSEAADLGFTYGTLEFATEQSWHASYYRIWKQHPTSVWRVVVDVLIPFAPNSE